jgi:8-oxo-dGTP pyrophosphatase MutT (NUDIX family)
VTDAHAVTPRDAATVILARQVDPASFECFMVRRHVSSDFAPDVYVFPGGKVDPDDRDPSLLRHIESDILRPTEVDFTDGDLGYRIAALRELFEEAGVVLAVDSTGTMVRVTPDAAERYAEYRGRLRSGATTLQAIAEQEGIRYTPGMLIPFSRWITPTTFPRRYDTRFFMALQPEGQEPLHDDVETTAGRWIAPAAALELYRQGEFPLVFATEKHLERLASYPSLSAVIQTVRPDDLQPVMPRPVDRNGVTEFLLPGDEGYAV